MPRLFSYSTPGEKEAAKQQALRSLRNPAKQTPKTSQEDLLGTGGSPQTPSQVDAEEIIPAVGAAADLPASAPAPKPAQAEVAPAAAYDRKIFEQIRADLKKNEPQFDAGKIQTLRRRIDENLAPENLAKQPGIQAYDSALNKLTEQIASVAKEKQAAVDRNQWAQVGEMFTNALTQYAAGLYGAKHGVDLSGVRYSKVDWQNQLNNQLSLLSDKITDLKEGRSTVERARRGEVGRLEKAGEEEYKTGLEAERGRVSSERDLNAKALSAAVAYNRTKNAEQAQEKKQAAALQKSTDAASKKNLADLIRKSEQEEAGLQQAVQIYADETLKPAQRARMAISALGKTQVDPAELEKQESPWYQVWGPSDQQLKQNFIQSLLKKQKEHTASLRAGNQPAAPVETAAPTPAQLAPEDQEALTWAEANPADPRAVEIKKRLGK